MVAGSFTLFWHVSDVSGGPVLKVFIEEMFLFSGRKEMTREEVAAWHKYQKQKQKRAGRGDMIPFPLAPSEMKYLCINLTNYV